MKKKEIRVGCKKCGSLMTYIRLKTNERVCRICGFIEKLGEKDGS